jgi:hypothetical protein
MRLHRWDNRSAPRISAIGRLCKACGLREYEAPTSCLPTINQKDTDTMASRFDYTEFSPKARDANQRITELAKMLETAIEEDLPPISEAGYAVTRNLRGA